jgi:hypothetical protein
VTEFDDFVTMRGPALLRFAYLLTGDRHQAEDVVQEALARCHGRWTSSGATRVTVGDHTGYLVSDSDGKHLVVDLGGGSTMDVIAPCSDEDLIRFAAGITVDLSGGI